MTPDASGSPFPLDGHNLWPALTAGTESPRTEVVHTIIKPPYNNKTCHKPLGYPCFWGNGIVNAGAAIRQQQWKLVIGYGGHPDVAAVLPQWQQPYNNTAQPTDGFDPTSPTVKCADHCLFDVVADPSEDRDVKAEHPEIVQRMLARMDALAKEGQPQLSSGTDQRDCQGVQETGYFFPYQDELKVGG